MRRLVIRFHKNEVLLWLAPPSPNNNSDWSDFRVGLLTMLSPLVRAIFILIYSRLSWFVVVSTAPTLGTIPGQEMATKCVLLVVK